jgi:sigma-E factor negative regulatory protein RseA
MQATFLLCLSVMRALAWQIIYGCKKMNQDTISAFVDSELAQEQVEEVLSALRDTQNGDANANARAAWDVYHHIGDVLRSEELAIVMLPNFQARMAARLAAEPNIIAPIAGGQAGMTEKAKRSWGRRFSWPGMAVAAAVLALIMTPQAQLLTPFKYSITTAALDNTSASVQSVQSARTAASIYNVVNTAMEATLGPVTASASAQGDVILRDPRIDDYLMAHQRYSPSVYSTAQYARSVTFATNKGK